MNIVNNRLAKAESLQAVAGAVILASTVPTDVARAMLWKAIGDHSGEGPDELLSAGLTTRVFNDPAFLLVLKSQKRADPKPESAAKRLKEIREGGRGPGGGPGGGSKPSGGGPPGGPSGYGGNSAPSQERSPEQRRMLACETMARALCAHFAAAGKVGGGSKEAAESRPFELPPRVETIAEYDFTWPESVSGKAKLSGVPLDPMAIHYVRMERETTPGRALSFFRRLPRAKEHPVDDGYWMESYAWNPETGRRLSIDVLISKKDVANTEGSKTGGPSRGPGGGPPGGGPPNYGPPNRGGGPGQGGEHARTPPPKRDQDTSAKLIIEVLSIEANSPDGTKGEAKPKAASEEEK